jgi:hypothetical protein
MGLYSAPVAAIIARLQAATATGKLLEGVKFEPYPIKDVEGETDMPSVRMFVPDLTETFVAKTTNRTSMVVPIMVATKRTSGCAVLMELVEKVLDVIERDASGNVDVTINSTCRKPFDVKSSENQASEVSLHARLLITIKPWKLLRRGKRRL